MRSSALERVIQRASGPQRDPDTRCDLCARPLASQHRHLLDAADGQVLCSCLACSILFGRTAASDGHYRLIPDRGMALPPVDAGRLGVPVGLAFFIIQPDGTVMAHYPSPAGATRWLTDPGAWRDVVSGCPALADLAPLVEALLINTTGDRREAWLVPVDDCYRLVAIVRREWTGMTGGDRVRPEIERFFDELRRKHG